MSALCESCGICCDGTLFTRVPLATEESVPEAALGVVRTATGARHVPQRCKALEGTRCTVYTERPLACRRFECLLFIAHRDGEVSLDDAQQVVRTAQHKARTEAPDLAAYLRFHFGRTS